VVVRDSLPGLHVAAQLLIIVSYPYAAWRRRISAFGISVSCQVTLGGCRTDVGERVALRKVSGGDERSAGHGFGELDGTGRRRKSRDLAGGEGCGSFSRAADLKDRHVFVRLQPQSFEQDSSRDVRGATDTADADAFAFELLGCADRLVNDQLIGKSVDETTDGNQARSADNRIGGGAAGDIADLDGARDESGDVRRRGWNKDEIRFQTVLLVELPVFGDVPVGVGRIYGTVGNLQSFLRVGSAANQTRREKRRAEQEAIEKGRPALAQFRAPSFEFPVPTRNPTPGNWNSEATE
jgi:hypothetical protein